jgi:hypothetical protein
LRKREKKEVKKGRRRGKRRERGIGSLARGYREE